MLQLFQVPGTSDKPDQDFIIVMDQAHFVNKLEDVDLFHVYCSGKIKNFVY